MSPWYLLQAYHFTKCKGPGLLSRRIIVVRGLRWLQLMHKDKKSKEVGVIEPSLFPWLEIEYKHCSSSKPDRLLLPQNAEFLHCPRAAACTSCTLAFSFSLIEGSNEIHKIVILYLIYQCFKYFKTSYDNKNSWMYFETVIAERNQFLSHVTLSHFRFQL